MRFRTMLIICCLALALPARVAAQENEEHHHHGEGEKLGTVVFPTSCSQDAQKSFERAVALLHSFQYTESEKGFVEIASSDSHCAMARWGEAMALYHQLWDKPKAATVKEGHNDLKQAMKIKERTPRETEFIQAALLFYDTNKKLDHDARTHRYSDAMGKMYEKYPDDSEVAAFYALSLLTWSPPDDKNYENRRKAIAVLNKLFAAQPDHPGAAHYLIHSADRPQLAPLALDAARRYAQIAPGSSHAIHMPSHIFSRMGLWDESIQSNLAAAAQAEREINAHLAEPHYEFHPMDYLGYAFLQSGREKDAWHVIEEVDTVPEASASQRAEVKTFFTARYYLELRDWAHAAALPIPSELTGHDRVDSYWARTIGAARMGDVAGASKDFEDYKSVDDGKDPYRTLKPGQVSVERQETAAWADYANGKKDDAVKEMRAAADQEDADAPEIAMIPAREMLADMLLEMNQPAEALVEYEKNQKESPNRFNGLYGAARAAELAGKPEQAAGYYSQLLKVCDGGAHSNRPELARAKTLLATK
ncbi:MAG TPA: hypothetical protein VEJ39_02235 [Candidatus Acidoferrales bacterium]|nr:hypothetical protein [Candidatus Acidoferrales bacterium]